MMKNLHLFAALLLVFAVPTGNSAAELQRPDYGLTFRSHRYNQDERTGLDLTPDRPLSIGPDFALEFDLRLSREDLTFGYVFRIISDEDASLDMVSNFNTNKINFILTRKHNTLANLDFQNSLQLQEGRWMHVCVAFDSKGITCRMDSVEQRVSHPMARSNRLRIIFGHNSHPVYYTTDVPPMTVRNVLLRNARQDTVAFWQLGRHNRNEVFDASYRHRAVVQNGIWEIDRHTRWQRIERWSLRDKQAQIALDPSSSRMFVATPDSVFVYDFTKHTFTRLPASGGAPFRSGGSHMIYDPQRNRLLSYSILFDDFIEYDFSSHLWSGHRSEGLPPIQHHSRLIDTLRRQLILFGGYGNHIYHAELATHSLDGGSWRRDSLAGKISPRYLCSMGFAGRNRVLIMGGYGSESGKQEESPCNLYDIHEVDLNTLECRKIGDFQTEHESLVLGNSMVVDTLSGKCYALAFRNDRFTSEIHLLEYDLRNHTTTTFGDSIACRFLDMETYVDLFFHKPQSRLYAVVLQAHENSRYDLEIHALAFPPLNAAAIRQSVPAKFPVQGVILGGVLVVLAAAGVLFLNRRRHGSPSRPGTSSTPPLQVPDSEISAPPAPTQQPAANPRSTILLLGGLRIFNRLGVDVTAEFTPISRQLLLLTLLNSADAGKGVTSQLLDETFWFGMNKAKASNNRNVNIRKLRLLLQEVGDIALTYNNGYWNLKLGPDVRCDYLDLMPLLGQMRSASGFQRETIDRVLALASKGVLLPNTGYEWLDAYKTRYSNAVIDALLAVERRPECRADDSLTLAIAKVILLHDCIDEDAIRILCRILYKKGQKGQSKQAYDRYCADYERLLGVHPDLEYEEMIAQ